MKVELKRRLYAARELVEVSVAHASLDALEIALELEHPTINEHNEIGDPPTLRRARAVARFTTALRCALTAYCTALERTLEGPDLPF